MNDSDRAKLIEDHLDLCARAARMIYPRVKEYITFEELVSLANVGLAEAASRFDPSRNVLFKTYAWYRVQGSIIDEIRRSTTLPRAVWRKLVALRAAAEYLEHKAEAERGATQKGAKPAEGADALAAIRSSIAAIRTMYLTSLEGLQEQKNFDKASDESSAPERMDTQRLTARLAEAIEQLPERERALMKKHYYEDKNLLEAGVELGISKSWASRLHAQAVDRLRRVVADDS